MTYCTNRVHMTMEPFYYVQIAIEGGGFDQTRPVGSHQLQAT